MQNPVEVPAAREAGGRPGTPAPVVSASPNATLSAASAAAVAAPAAAVVPELGGPTGPEPTRYGDWEKKGRCIDF